MKENRQTVLEIDTKAFKNNIKSISKYTGKTIIPVIKANAYGTHLNKKINLIKDFDVVAVALVSEAIDLRLNGFKKDIFVINQPYKEDIDNIIMYNLTVGVCDYEFIEELGESHNYIKVHLELDTGMGRTGIQNNEIDKYVKLLKKYENLIVEGVYTHLSTPQNNEYTKKQLDLFNDGITKLKKSFYFRYIHTQASSGLLNYECDVCNAVRPGISLYGYNSEDKIKLTPVATLKSKISYLKEVEKDTYISYNMTYKTNEKTKVATVMIGYADGIRRCLSNNADVVINNTRCKIIGTICMDSFMVDVTHLTDVKVGDEVYIWDNKIITLDEVSEKCNTINYEILSTITDRVPRIFK